MAGKSDWVLSLAECETLTKRRHSNTNCKFCKQKMTFSDLPITLAGFRARDNRNIWKGLVYR